MSHWTFGSVLQVGRDGFMSDAATEDKILLDRYECKSCGYIYEPLKGDSTSQIKPGTAFESLQVNWRCPVCGVAKPNFINIGPKGAASGFEENLGYGLGVNTLTPGQKNILIFGSLGVMFLLMLSLYGLH